MAKNILNISPEYQLNLVKSSHIIVSKLYDHNNAFILQHRDQRIIFVILYYDHFSLIGTTEVILDNLFDEASISAQEEDYLCGIANAFLKKYFF